MVKYSKNHSLKEVPIEQQKKLPMPPVYMALGVAFSYYLYPIIENFPRGHFLYLCLYFIIIVTVCIFRVFNYLSREKYYLENRDRKTMRLLSKAGIIAISVAVGFPVGTFSRMSFPDYPEMGLREEKVIAVSGLLRDDPRSLHGTSGLGTLQLHTCYGLEGLRASARGRIIVFFPAESISRLKEFGRGCEIYVDGFISTGKNNTPLFNALSVHIVKQADALEQFRTGLRMTLLDKFQDRQGRNTVPVWGAFASAMLLGVRDDLDVDLSEGFRKSGCAHILALSGMHLAILTGVLAFLIRRPLGIRAASIIGAFFVIFYVFVAGSQPSLVRSAIMYLIGALGVWGFLKGKAISLLSVAFIIQIIFESETGTSLSFILSYLALLGILTLGNSLRSIFRGRVPESINGTLSASLGAFLATAPIVVFYFGSLWPIGILAGLVIAPLSSIFLVFALAALASGFLPIPLWDVFDFILTLLYRLLELFVSLAGQVPGFSYLNPVPVLLISIFMWLMILFIQKLDYAKRSSIASFD